MNHQYVLTTPLMKRLLQLAGILVLIIGLPLFIAPTMTDLLFSWTVNPPITAAFLGCAYLAAFVIETMSSRENHWSNARIAVPAVLFFTSMTLIATLLHIDKFHFGAEFPMITQLITYVWLLVYAAVPVLMAALWFIQTRQPGSDREPTLRMPGWSKLVFSLQAVTMLAIGVALFGFPDATKGAVWPWALSALTARAIGAWLLGVGLLAAHIVIENDFSRVRNAMGALVLFSILELFSLWRLADNQTPDGPVVEWAKGSIWVYITFLLSLLLVNLHGWLVSRQSK